MTTQTTAAPLVVGELVRVTNPKSWYTGMTGRIEAIGPGGALVSLSTRHNEAHTFALSDLARVPDAAGSK